jgi:hypothetical protein
MLAASMLAGAHVRADQSLEPAAPLAQVTPATMQPTAASTVTPSSAPTHAPRHADGLEPLAPGVSEHPYHLDPGVRPYQYRLSVSPAYGFLGSGDLFSFRLTYNPNHWLGYEAALGHNPGHSVHAVLHTFSAILRRPLPGRLQPYLSGGYGMVIVFPGPSLNAAPVTKNALVMGGGCEWFIRNDLALRGDLREATVFGSQRAQPGVVLYDYVQGTIGLAFYRSIRP